MKKFFLFLLLTTYYLLFTPAEASSYFPKTSYLHYVKYQLYIHSGAFDKAMVELILAYQTNLKAWELCGEIVELALELNQIGVAELYSQKAYEANPNKAEVLLWRAKTLRAQRNFLGALEFLHRAQELEPESSDILLETASVYADLNQKAQAARYLEKYLKLNPEALDLLKVKASLELEQKDPEALSSYQKAFKMDSGDTEIIEGLISSYEIFSSRAALKKFLKEARQKDPDNIMFERLLCGLELGADKKACLENLLTHTNLNRDVVLDLLEFLESAKLWDEALELLRSHAEIFGDEPMLSVKESYYLLNQGVLEEALDILSQASKKHPDNLEILYFLALGLQDSGRLEESEKALEKIYANRPDWREASYNYALLLSELGRDEKTEEVLTSLWKRYPDDPNVLNALGFTWSESGKNLSQARILIEQAVQKEPKNLFYQDSLAWILFKLGDTEKAKLLLEEVASQVKDPEILIHLAVVQAALSQEREAWETLWEARFQMDKKSKISQPRLYREWEKTKKELNPKARPSLIQVLSRRAKATQEFSSLFRCDWKIKSQRFRTKMNVKFDSQEDFQVLFWPPGQFAPLRLEEAIRVWPQKGDPTTSFQAIRQRPIPETSFRETRPDSNRGESAEKRWWGEAFKELNLALEEFFKNRSWAEPRQKRQGDFRWKIRRDDVLRFEGRRVRLDFSNFYYLDDKTLTPRFIKFKTGSLECECETLDGKK